MESKNQSAALLLYQLNRLKKLRDEQQLTGLTPEQRMLRQWQSTRLAKTYEDLLASPRYKPATEFFLTELYGEQDFGKRDQDLERAYPIMVRTMPPKLLDPLAMAVELNALSHELDAELARVLVEELGVRENLTEEQYAQAYRLCDSYDRRLHQIELIQLLGRKLNAAVATPFIYTVLRLSKGPTHLAGFGELHTFIDNGYKAFRHMGDAGEFLHTIVTREQRILDRIHANHPHPFALDQPD
jgi:hypothetical protein